MSIHIQSVRVRTTIGASLVVFVALVIAGAALVATLHRSQLDAVDNSLELRAIDIESLIDGGASPESVAVQSDEDGLVQIIEGTTVVASSENIDGEPALSNDQRPSRRSPPMSRRSTTNRSVSSSTPPTANVGTRSSSARRWRTSNEPKRY